MARIHCLDRNVHRKAGSAAKWVAFLFGITRAWNASPVEACLSMQRILQGGPLPIASNGERLIVGGQYFFPSSDAPKHELRSTILIYSIGSRQVKVFRSNDTKELPKIVTAVAMSKDTDFVNGQSGVISRQGGGAVWRSLPGLESKQVTALAWDGTKLWVGTASDLSIYERGHIIRSFDASKYFDGFGIISIVPVGNEIFIGGHKPPPARTSNSSSLDECGHGFKGVEMEEAFQGAAYVTDINGEKFSKVDPNGVFNSGAKPRVLFDVYPSTIAGKLEFATGDGLNTAINELSSGGAGDSVPLVPSGLFIAKYNPFLALIAKAGRESGERQAAAIADFLEQSWELLPLNARLWAFDAQFSLWARNNQWQRFKNLDDAKELWAASFLSTNADPNAQDALVSMIKQAGASVGIIDRLEHGAGSEVDSLLVSILKGRVRFAPEKAATSAIYQRLAANDRDPQRVYFAAIRSLRMRLGKGAAPHFLALLKSNANLPDETQKNIRQALYDLAPGKWVLQQVVISGHMLIGGNVLGGLNTPTGPYVTWKEKPERKIREAYLSKYKPNGDFSITLALPVKGTYVLHYGKDRAKSRSFSTNEAPLNLGHLE